MDDQILLVNDRPDKIMSQLADYDRDGYFYIICIKPHTGCIYPSWEDRQRATMNHFLWWTGSYSNIQYSSYGTARTHFALLPGALELWYTPPTSISTRTGTLCVGSPHEIVLEIAEKNSVKGEIGPIAMAVTHGSSILGPRAATKTKWEERSNVNWSLAVRVLRNSPVRRNTDTITKCRIS